MADSIAELKKQLEKKEEISISRQRWFFSGKLLTDKTRLQDANIQKDFVVQVILNMNSPVVVNWFVGQVALMRGKWKRRAREGGQK